MANAIDRIDVVATVIYCQEKLLTIRNPNWGAFTIPMTKLRTRPLGLTDATRWELGEEAAMRNVAEWLGITSGAPPLLLADFGNLGQSDRSGQVNHYAFQVFGFPVAEPQVGPCIAAQWLTTAEILDSRRQPISPTARELVRALMGAAVPRKSAFPPPPPGGPLRESVASIAIISPGKDGEKKWLCQWNPHWERYFLVGGHRDAGEAAIDCMTRELKEELGLVGGDYACDPRQLLEPVDWSTSAWQMTQYSISTFDVQLVPSALGKIRPDPANRWITAQEIRSERCTDDKPISPTTRKILELLGEL